MQSNITNNKAKTTNPFLTLCLLAWCLPVNAGGPIFTAGQEVEIQDSTPDIQFTDIDTGEADWVIFVDPSGAPKESFSIWNFESNTIPFLIENGAPTNALYVDDIGRVGIGTAAPVSDLQIASVVPEIKFESTVGNLQTWTIFGNASLSGFGVRDGNAGDVPFRIKAGAGHEVLLLESDGSVSISGPFRVASSRSSKRDIHALNPHDARAAVQHLSPVRFRYKNSDQKQLGFVAEDLPALIATKDGKSLRPMDVVTLLTSVIQQHDRENHLLEKKLKHQDEMMAKLMERIERLEAPRKPRRRHL